MSDEILLDSYDQPNILFLRGCFLSDCNTIEDLFDERLAEAFMPENKLYDFKDITYDKIPKKFTTVENWVKKTNLKCWSCDCKFHNFPIFIPTSIERSDNPDRICGNMDVHGNFCSWNCAAQYINLHYTGYSKWEHHEMLKLLYKIFTGVEIDEIIPSHCKTNMEQYGGKQTQQEYRNELAKLNENHILSIKHSSIDNITKK